VIAGKGKIMGEHTWKTIITVQGELQAEVMRGLLEAQGIPVNLSQEGVARAYGLGVGPLSEVDIMVPDQYVEEADRVIERYQSGEFEELGDQLDNESEEL
jgi:hypothetical protein